MDDELSMVETKELEQLLRRKARTIRQWVSDGRFPRPVVYGRWLREDVVRWMRDKPVTDRK